MFVAAGNQVGACVHGAFVHGSMNQCGDMGVGSGIEVLYHVHACTSEGEYGAARSCMTLHRVWGVL